MAYAGNTSALLRQLAFGTSLPMLLGIFLVRAIPLSPTTQAMTLEPLPSPEFTVSERELLLSSEDTEDPSYVSSI